MGSTPLLEWAGVYFTGIFYLTSVWYLAGKAGFTARASLRAIEYASVIEYLGLAYLARLNLLVIFIATLPALAHTIYYLQYMARGVIIEPRPVLLNGLGIILSPTLGAGVLLANTLATTTLDLALVTGLLGILIANVLVVIIVLLYEEASGYIP